MNKPTHKSAARSRVQRARMGRGRSRWRVEAGFKAAHLLDLLLLLVNAQRTLEPHDRLHVLRSRKATECERIGVAAGE